jgi:hypothetical protein
MSGVSNGSWQHRSGIAAFALIAAVGFKAPTSLELNSSASAQMQSQASASRWYPDRDSDGFGDWYRFLDSHVRPSGFVSNHSDCDDTKAAVNPAAADLGNGLDNSCDGGDVLGPEGGVACGPDTLDCDQDSHDAIAHAGDDCDDGNQNRYPGNVEVPDGIDNDCDARTADTGYNRPYDPTRFVALDAPRSVR